MRITLHVNANTPKWEVNYCEGSLHVSVPAPREKGAANRELIRFLNRMFRKSLHLDANVRLVHGHKSTTKTVDVACTPDQLEETIRSYHSRSPDAPQKKENTRPHGFWSKETATK